MIDYYANTNKTPVKFKLQEYLLTNKKVLFNAEWFRVTTSTKWHIQ